MLKKMFVLLVVLAMVAIPGFAQKAGKNGTTLAAQKTLEVCDAGNGIWEYSGEISVWNEGVLDTQGIAITDCVQYKLSTGTWQTVFCPVITASEIPAGTTLATATTFPYSFQAPASAGTLRNSASVKILNHSGSIGKAAGPEPKYTYYDSVAPCVKVCGCTYSQGYWGNKPDVVWPAPYDRNAPFFLSGQTWQEVLDTPSLGNGYYILAHQYIASVLNQANGACTTPAIQDVIDAATGFFTTALPSGCSLRGTCGLQKTAAGLLDDYIHGVYPGSPGHCGEE